MTHYRRALDESRRRRVEVEPPPDVTSDADLARWQREMRRANEGPDETPLVHRVLLGLACGVILAAFALVFWWELLRHR